MYKCCSYPHWFFVVVEPVLLQQPQEEDSPSAMCELLPALERRDGLSGSNSLYHMTLSDAFTLTPLGPNSRAELPSQSSPTDRTTGSRTPNSKRTIDGSSSGPSAKKARRRTADRLPLVQHNAEKKQKDSNNVSPILQKHNKPTVCVCWNTRRHINLPPPTINLVSSGISVPHVCPAHSLSANQPCCRGCGKTFLRD